MKEKRFALGLDYGTSSVRALIVDLTDGSEVAISEFAYPSGTQGVLTDPQNPLLARQSPNDYVEGLYETISQAVRVGKQVGFEPELLAGIGVDTTGSTPIPVDRQGRPLVWNAAFQNELAANAWLWKDHTSHEEARLVTELASKRPERYLSKCGGTYSSEWFWAKILHCKKENPAVFDAAFSWVELADFIPAFLTGTLDPITISRSVCAAGHKAMYHPDWGGLPAEDFLAALDPALVPLRSRFAPAKTSDQVAGYLTAEIATKTGLAEGTPVAVGAFDAHMGAVGAGVRPGTLVKIIGTSTCDVAVAPLDVPLPDIPGLCGIVPGSVLPDAYGLEAGQSAVGDIFNWFVRRLVPEEYARSGDVHAALTKEAAALKPGESGLLALDWNNGNRCVLVDPLLSGMILGTSLHTKASEIYRSLVEATAFGARTIIQRFEEYGVSVDQVVACGGISSKSPFLMQIYADVFNRPTHVCPSTQTCALGAALFGAVCGKAFDNVEQACRRTLRPYAATYRPEPNAVAVYEKLFALYSLLHDAFGKTGRRPNLDSVMKDLIQIRQAATL